MSILTGSIEAKEDIIKNGHDKTVLTLEMPDNQSCFVEFRGPMMMRIVSSFALESLVRITVTYEAKMSKGSGIRFNNIVAKSIEVL